MSESVSSNIYRFWLKGMVSLFLIAQLTNISVANQKIALGRMDSLKTKHLWIAAQILPGSGQIINRQYWKAPTFYAGMGGMIYLGLNADKTYRQYKSDYLHLDPSVANKEPWQERYTRMKQKRNLYYAGAGAFYLASVVDALLVYNKNAHSPATATILSTILPGAGQAYNRKYWKVPVVFGGLSTFLFLVDWNNRGYVRFKRAVRQYPNDEFNKGQKPYVRSEDEFIMYRDIYRKNRDLSFVGIIAVYALNIIDANVDANLYDWNISDDLSLRIEPSIINSNFASTNYTESALGLTCRFSF